MVSRRNGRERYPLNPIRTLATVTTEFDVVDAWRNHKGLGLCYFIAVNSDVPEDGDRSDLRAVLEADEALDSLSSERLQELFASGAPLTDTERRFETPNGGRWLAQSIGPVWAEGVATGLTGVLFTDLAGDSERRQTASGPIAAISDEELLRLWTEATRESEADPQEPA